MYQLTWSSMKIVGIITDADIFRIIQLLFFSSDKNSDSGDKNKIQTDRKRRAAAFLSSLKGPGESARHQSSLASAMAETLHTLQDCRDGGRRHRRRDDRKKSKKSRRESRERHYSGSFNTIKINTPYS